jgi:hypothetical protein
MPTASGFIGKKAFETWQTSKGEGLPKPRKVMLRQQQRLPFRQTTLRQERNINIGATYPE